LCWPDKALGRYGLKAWIKPPEAVAPNVLDALANKACPHRLGGAG